MVNVVFGAGARETRRASDGIARVTKPEPEDPQRTDELPVPVLLNWAAPEDPQPMADAPAPALSNCAVPPEAQNARDPLIAEVATPLLETRTVDDPVRLTFCVTVPDELAPIVELPVDPICGEAAPDDAAATVELPETVTVCAPVPEDDDAIDELPLPVSVIV